MKCFNPRPPCGGRHYRAGRVTATGIVSIHAPRAEGDDIRELCVRVMPGNVSIHAPRAEGDARAPRHPAATRNSVSIHAPRAEGDRFPRPAASRSNCFNPRPPCGGRQALGDVRLRAGRGVSIHAPRAEGDRDLRRAHGRVLRGVSIHAPRAEGDARRSAGPERFRDVSIHAPRAEGDNPGPPPAELRTGFNPRPPCGGRLTHKPRG